MTEDEIIAALTPDEIHTAAHARVADELLATAATQVAAGHAERAMIYIRVADAMARAASRLDALQGEPSLAKFGVGQEMAKSSQALHVNVGEARNNLSRLIAHAIGGGDVVLCRSGFPVVRLTRIERALAEPPAAVIPEPPQAERVFAQPP